LASVSADDVRDVVNVSSAEVPDAKVLKMVKRAEVTLELETNKEIVYSIIFRLINSLMEPIRIILEGARSTVHT